MFNALQRTLISFLIENVCKSEIHQLYDRVVYYGINEPLLNECRSYYIQRELEIECEFNQINQFNNEEIVQWVRSNLLCCDVLIMFTMSMKIIQSGKWYSVTSDILTILLDDLALF